jgi:hypothetical protein
MCNKNLKHNERRKKEKASQQLSFTISESPRPQISHYYLCVWEMSFRFKWQSDLKEQLSLSKFTTESHGWCGNHHKRNGTNVTCDEYVKHRLKFSHLQEAGPPNPRRQPRLLQQLVVVDKHKNAMRRGKETIGFGTLNNGGDIQIKSNTHSFSTFSSFCSS